MKNFIQIKTISRAFSAFLLALLTIHTVQAQYCTSNPTSNAYESISRVTLQGNNRLLDQVSNTFPTTVCETYTDNTSLPPVELSAGGKYTLRVISTTCTGTTFYTHRTLAWIDYNRNNVFEAGEAVATLPITATSTPFTFTFNFTVPCNINPGNTRMRIVMIEGALNNPANACGTYTWGETEDYTVSLQLPSGLNAGFVAPNSAWIKSVVKFINNNQTGYISHSWDANNDGTNEAPNSVNFNYTWQSSGNKCVKLKSTNCLGSDSLVKCLTVNIPQAVPVANFVADNSVVEQYTSARFYDLSSNGPYQWVWNVYDSSNIYDVKDLNSGDVISDPNGTGANEFSQNPEFSFERPGCYTVELVSRNDIGASQKMVKKCYITVIMPTQYSLGFGSYGVNADNIVESSTGTIFDNGGASGNYSSNQGLGTRSFLQITPCNAKKIELTMTQLRFAGPGDKLSVWDGKSPGGPNSTLLATWSNTSRPVQKVTALSGSMYILFESDGTGVDSGFAGNYISELGPPVVPTPAFAASSTPLYNSSPAVFRNTTMDIVGVPTWLWTVDDVEVSRKTNLQYNFDSDGQYKVCLEVLSCAGNKKTCQMIDVVTPNQPGKLDLLVSNRRPNIGTEVVALRPVYDNANRFEWTIFPTTYTLVNPPSSPSSYGAGYIRYNATPGDSVPVPMIRFTSPGCYTIALKAYNAIDPTATSKTIVRNNYICAVEYCGPASLILAGDIGINNVKLTDGNVEIMNNTSLSGISAYTNYSKEKFASLTFGRTYELQVSRNTNSDPANRKVWIDWNIDGDFNDAGEEVLSESSTYNKTVSTSITVPNINESFVGQTRMRVAINFDSENTTPCGPLTAGEYEDYGLILYKDNSKPVITLKENDSIRIEVNSYYKDAGASAYDDSEGDITHLLEFETNLDTSTTGLYTYEYNVTDNSGNQAATAVRTIIVVNDLTPPVLTLNPGGSGCIEARRDNGPYIDPGAIAYNTNPLINLNSAIRSSGFVDTRKVGVYTITYTVQDFAGNMATADRIVCVEDKTAPEIFVVSDTLIQIGSVWVNQVTAEDAYDLNPVVNRTWTPSPVDATVKGVYTAIYTAEDASGNLSAPKTVNYRVDDYIAPVINLNTFDVVEHDVNTRYNSVQASVTDNYYGPGQVSVVRTGSNVDENTVGSYTEVFKAVDGSNNVSFKTRTVNVVDRIAPTLWGGTIYSCVGENIWPMWGLSTTDNYYGPSALLPRVEIVQQNVNPWEEGMYFITYRVTDPSGNTSAPLTRSVVYTYWPKCSNSTTSIDDQKSPEDLVSVYPNPSGGLMKIDFRGMQASDILIEACNQLGQVVYSINVNGNSSASELDLRGLASGVYTLKIQSIGQNGGQTINKRIVIQ